MRTSISSPCRRISTARLILPENYVESAVEEIPQAKIHAQQRLTVQQLRRLTVLK